MLVKRQDRNSHCLTSLGLVCSYGTERADDNSDVVFPLWKHLCTATRTATLIKSTDNVTCHALKQDYTI